VRRSCNSACQAIGLGFLGSWPFRAVTIHAAGQIGMADQLGSLESGKLADLTILEQDPYKVDPDALMNIKVSETWVGGQKKFG
jgi:hypothetical protein